MRGTPVIAAQSIVFSNLYYTGRFEVPWHQRFYDWKREHVVELLDDLWEAVEVQRPCYFLGTIMLVKNEHEDRSWIINDGQQRMVTFSLLCARLGHLFAESQDSLREARAFRILFDVDANSMARFYEAETSHLRLKPHTDEENLYRQLVQGHSIGANGKLTAAWQEIDRFVSSMDATHAAAFLEFLIRSVEVTSLYVPPTVDPNAVFETINSRGKQLEDWDLIRNDLYSYFNGDRERARQRVVHANLERIRTRLGEKKALNYARSYLQYRYGFLPKGNFHKETRKRIRASVEHHATTPEGRAGYIYRLVTDLSRPEYLDLFRTLTNPREGEDFIRQFHTDSRTTNSKRNLLIFLKELQTYTVTQTITFALLRHYITAPTSQDRKRLARIISPRLRQLTSFVMRTAFVSPKFEPSRLEEAFATHACLPRADLMDNRTTFTSFLKDCDALNVMDNAAFTERLCTQKMDTAKKTKRFLLGINRLQQTDAALLNDERCTVEHVLPESSEYWPTWQGFTGVDPTEWRYRIGNLTLLGEADNKPGDWNQNFQRKKPVYQRSAIGVTRALAQYDEWTPVHIEDRQRELAHAAASVWSFEP